jgi:hypothetical protein
MSRFDLSHTPEPVLSSHNSGKEGEMQRPASSEHPMTLSQCLVAVGLFVLALVFSFFVVFSIDPIVLDLHRSTSHAMSPAAASRGDRQ